MVELAFLLLASRHIREADEATGENEMTKDNPVVLMGSKGVAPIIVALAIMLTAMVTAVVTRSVYESKEGQSNSESKQQVESKTPELEGEVESQQK